MTIKFKGKLAVDTTVLDNLKENLVKATSQVGKAGFTSDQIHPKHKEPLSNIAFFNTFGSKGGHIPERPFMQDGALDSRINISKQLAKGFTEILVRGDSSKSLKAGADTLAHYISSAIREGNFYPNASETIRKKGKGKPPMTDTGYLASAIKTYLDKKD